MKTWIIIMMLYQLFIIIMAADKTIRKRNRDTISYIGGLIVTVFYAVPTFYYLMAVYLPSWGIGS